MHGDTVAEVLEGLSRQLPQLQPHVRAGKLRVVVVGFDTVESLYQPLEEVIEIHVVPQVNGGKNAMSQILIGALLVGLAMIPGVGAALGAKLTSALLKIGALQVLGGLAQLLAPSPQTDTDQSKSQYLGAPRNTTKIGTRIPILYGECRAGGHYLSFDINAFEFRGNGETTKSGK